MTDSFYTSENIRQMGQFGDTYKIYVEDFVYTYVHRTLPHGKQEHEIAAAVLPEKNLPAQQSEHDFYQWRTAGIFFEWGQLMKQIRCSILQKMI